MRTRKTKQIKTIKNIFIILVLQILLILIPEKKSVANTCDLAINIQKEYSDGATLLKNGLYLLHLQLMNENFSSPAANQSRAEMLDSIFNIRLWKSKISTEKEFNLFWNWIRFQFWGLIQQQGLLKEEQSFKIARNRNLNLSFSSIYKFPIYPVVLTAKRLICNTRQSYSYPCTKPLYEYEVLLSPAVACDSGINQNNLTFKYILMNEGKNWSLIDINFKGRELILDSFFEYDNMVNRSGSDKARTYLELLLSKVNLIDPTEINNYGSIGFEKKYKMKVPNYPLKY